MLGEILPGASLARHFASASRCWAPMVLGVALVLCAGMGKSQEPAPTPQVNGEQLGQARKCLLKKVETLRWIAFTPSRFSPKTGQALNRVELEADLKVLAAARFDGLVTYSCTPVASAAAEGLVGFSDIPGLARAAGFRGCIAGIWNPADKAEVNAAVDLARHGLVDAVCVGNEGLDDRYDWATLQAVIADVRTRGSIPCTTTEQIEDYSFDGLRDPDAVDLILPNCHAVFQNEDDPVKAAEWTVYMLQELRKLVGDDGGRVPILLKETGWPSSGMPYHNEANQRVFWREFEKRARDAKVFHAWFESFDQSWKNEPLLGTNVGPHWGLFTADRQPKLVLRPDGR